MTNFIFKETKRVTPAPYQAELAAVGEVDGKFGPQLRADFRIVAGQFKGELISQWVSLTFNSVPIQPTSRNKLGRLLTSLNAGPFDDGASIDPAKFVGQTYTVVVIETDKGRVAIDSITAPMS